MHRRELKFTVLF